MPKSEAVDLEAFVEACLQERARRVCPSLPAYRLGMEPLHWHELAEHWPDGVVRASWFGVVAPRSRSPPRSRAEAIDVAAAPVGRVTSTREDCASRYAGIGGRNVVLTLSLLSLSLLWTSGRELRCRGRSGLLFVFCRYWALKLILTLSRLLLLFDVLVLRLSFLELGCFQAYLFWL